MLKGCDVAKRAPGDQEGTKWLKKRQLARRALIAKKARNGKEGVG